MIVLTDKEIGEIFRQPWPSAIFADGANGILLDEVCFRDVVRMVEKAAYMRGYNKARNAAPMEPMQHTKKRTNWISGDVTPVRRGWYEAHGIWCEGGGDRKCIAMRYWNGKRWMWRNIYRNGRLVGAAVGSEDKWRGLVGPNV